ncbi:MAG TPA: cytochrome c, partial [Gallionella sp.]|nr:cytochrome c [Gallionella sp.]
MNNKWQEQEYKLETDKPYKCRPKDGSMSRMRCRAGVALIAMIAVPAVAHAADMDILRRLNNAGKAFVTALGTEPDAANATSAEQIVTSTCSACHGADGKAVAPVFPNLAGQSRVYLKKQLQDFVEGRRTNSIMSPNAAALKPEEVDALATYFSAQSLVPTSATGNSQFLEASMASLSGNVTDSGVVTTAKTAAKKVGIKKSGTGKSSAKKSSTGDSVTDSVNTAWLVEAGKT